LIHWVLRKVLRVLPIVPHQDYDNEKNVDEEAKRDYATHYPRAKVHSAVGSFTGSYPKYKYNVSGQIKHPDKKLG
jgi:hypothetical protein